MKTLQSKHTGSQSVKGSSSEKPSVEKSRQKRIHPGMLSTLDRATAHYGAVTGLKATNDGMYLLSAGKFILSWLISLFFRLLFELCHKLL